MENQGAWALLVRLFGPLRDVGVIKCIGMLKEKVR